MSVYPILNILMVSLSTRSYVSAGVVKLIPKGFNFNAYIYAFSDPQIFMSLAVTFAKVIIGVLISLIISILTAYPLSLESEEFPLRTFFAYYYIITMLFGGGLIATFLTIKYIGLYDTFWVLVIPTAAGAGQAILLLNFFRGLPKELKESAFVDGAGHWDILFRVVVPLSKAVIATVTVFLIIGHWNDWFAAIIYTNNPNLQPLQTYLRSKLNSVVLQLDNSRGLTIDQLMALSKIDDTIVRASLIIISALPILFVYPFMQKYFVKGVVLGSVKG